LDFILSSLLPLFSGSFSNNLLSFSSFSLSEFSSSESLFSCFLAGSALLKNPAYFWGSILDSNFVSSFFCPKTEDVPKKPAPLEVNPPKGFSTGLLNPNKFVFGSFVLKRPNREWDWVGAETGAVFFWGLSCFGNALGSDGSFGIVFTNFRLKMSSSGSCGADCILLSSEF